MKTHAGNDRKNQCNPLHEHPVKQPSAAVTVRRAGGLVSPRVASPLKTTAEKSSARCPFLGQEGGRANASGPPSPVLVLVNNVTSRISIAVIFIYFF